MVLEALRIGLAILIAIVWAISFAAGLISETYQPDASVHLLMMAVVGALFGEQYLKRRNGPGGEQ